MNKKISCTVMMLITTISVLLLAGCKNKEHKVYEEGLFKYIIVGENSKFPDKNNKAVVTIAGFTEEGEKLESIDIPREIAGKPVVNIGHRDEGFWHYNSHAPFSEKLRKIYVQDNIKNIVYFEGSEVDLMLCSANEEVNFLTFFFLKRFYIYKIDFEKETYPSYVFPANVVFLENRSSQDDEQYYRLDNVELGGKIPLPPEPIRSGYEFNGWYTEPECINAWDFDSESTVVEDAEFRLYAKWLVI